MVLVKVVRLALLPSLLPVGHLFLTPVDSTPHFSVLFNYFVTCSVFLASIVIIIKLLYLVGDFGICQARLAIVRIELIIRDDLVLILVDCFPTLQEVIMTLGVLLLLGEKLKPAKLAITICVN